MYYLQTRYILLFLQYYMWVNSDVTQKSLLVRSGTLLYMLPPTKFTSSHLFS